MSTIIFIAILAATLFFTYGRKRLQLSNPNIKNVTGADAQKVIQENKNMLILDVRSKGEYEGGHIPNAKLIPAHELPARINEIQKHKDLPVLVYCASGGRSPGAVSTLIKNNFTNIYHLSKGISSWPYEIKR